MKGKIDTDLTTEYKLKHTHNAEQTNGEIRSNCSSLSSDAVRTKVFVKLSNRSIRIPVKNKQRP